MTIASSAQDARSSWASSLDPIRALTLGLDHLRATFSPAPVVADDGGEVIATVQRIATELAGPGVPWTQMTAGEVINAIRGDR